VEDSGHTQPILGKMLGVESVKTHQQGRSYVDYFPARRPTLEQPCNSAGHQPAVFFVLVPALPVLITTFTASSIGSLKGTSIRSKPCS
jgi:hypothetical protein